MNEKALAEEVVRHYCRGVVEVGAILAQSSLPSLPEQMKLVAGVCLHLFEVQDKADQLAAIVGGKQPASVALEEYDELRGKKPAPQVPQKSKEEQAFEIVARQADAWRLYQDSGVMLEPNGRTGNEKLDELGRLLDELSVRADAYLNSSASLDPKLKRHAEFRLEGCPFCGDTDVVRIKYPMVRGTWPAHHLHEPFVIEHESGRECRGEPPEQPRDADECRATGGKSNPFHGPKEGDRPMSTTLWVIANELYDCLDLGDDYGDERQAVLENLNTAYNLGASGKPRYSAEELEQLGEPCGAPAARTPAPIITQPITVDMSAHDQGYADRMRAAGWGWTEGSGHNEGFWFFGSRVGLSLKDTVARRALKDGLIPDADGTFLGPDHEEGDVLTAAEVVERYGAPDKEDTNGS